MKFKIKRARLIGKLQLQDLRQIKDADQRNSLKRSNDRCKEKIKQLEEDPVLDAQIKEFLENNKKAS